MASIYTLKSHSYNGRYMYITCTQTPDVATNTSKIDWTLTVTGGSNNYYTTGPTTVKINGVQVYYKAQTAYSTHKFPAAKGSVSGSLTIQHDDNGDASIPVSIKTNIYNGVLKTSSGTWTLDSNPRQATLTSATNFTDQTGPTITYSNPLGAAVPSLQVGISLDGTSDCAIPYRDIDKTAGRVTIEFSETDLTRLYAATPAENSDDKNSRTVWIYLRTRIGETYFYSPMSKIFTITDPEPTITVGSIVDTNTATVNLTGDSSKLVKYYSNANIVFTAAAVKGASLTSTSVVCGNKSRSDSGVINNIESNTFGFKATDSRGNVMTKTATTPFVEYIKPTCNVANTIPDGNGDMELKVTGNYFNGSFGKVSNALTVQYRYKIANGSYGNWTTMTVTPNGNTYTATAALANLDYQTAYVFEAKAVDKLETAQSSEKTVKATPVFDWGENDFKFNVPVYIGSNEIRAKRCVVGQNGTGGNDSPWYKYASVTTSAMNEDHRVSFKVTFGYGAHTKFGTLNAIIRSQNSSGANAIHRLEFESDTGLDPSNFVMAYSGTTPGSTYELWVKLTEWHHCMFEVLTESSRIEFENSWTLYNQISIGYAAAPTDGYTILASTSMLDRVYPVGSYYISANSTSPASLFGGTWRRIESRFLWGAPASSTLGLTAGEQTHTLTVDEMPSHRHEGLYYTNGKKIALNSGSVAYELSWTSSAGKDADEIYTAYTGGGAAHNNMPPYVNVAIWRREA